MAQSRINRWIHWEPKLLPLFCNVVAALFVVILWWRFPVFVKTWFVVLLLAGLLALSIHHVRFLKDKKND